MRKDSSIPYVYQKRGVYYFSRRVPKDLCPSPLYLNHSDKISMFCGEVFDDTEAFF